MCICVCWRREGISAPIALTAVYFMNTPHFCKCTHTCKTHTHIYTHANTQTDTHTHTYTHANTQTDTHTHTHEQHTHIHTHEQHTHTHTHTHEQHTHTHTPKSPIKFVHNMSHYSLRLQEGKYCHREESISEQNHKKTPAHLVERDFTGGAQIGGYRRNSCL